ncbi:hypothetical protein FEM48_Zijuj04G0056000 [Ziziphus jujuba var. spinosa]|uniref:Uncharacterized protein n=1 Tax=Ziziphus jujuba var. spinosa TaxID=714518 RepID=A0A978VI38_ZIZJJ|nr:hypothetical protein FEM48_Zijuj04G0056000 [Ziziphus jujuba var. spinosa]
MFQNSPMSSGVNAHLTQLCKLGFVNPALFNSGPQGQYPVGVFGHIMTPHVNHAFGGGQFGSGLSLSNAGGIHLDGFSFPVNTNAHSGVTLANTRHCDSICSSGVEYSDFGSDFGCSNSKNIPAAMPITPVLSTSDIGTSTPFTSGNSSEPSTFLPSLSHIANNSRFA